MFGGARVVRLLLFALALAGGSISAARAASEYDVKAAYLYNFAKFVDWPASAFTTANAPLVLCVVGGDPFGPALGAIEGKLIAGRPLRIQYITARDGLGDCHIAFIGALDTAGRLQVLERLGSKPVLTVADTPGFATQGGMINFVVADGRVQFAVNPAAATRVGLTLRAYLLKVAIVVSGQG